MNSPLKEKVKLCKETSLQSNAGHLCICSNAGWHKDAAAVFAAPGMKRHACNCGTSWHDDGDVEARA